MAAARYGVILGVALVLATRLAPQPVGSIVYWSFVGLDLTWGAVTCWRRTGLPFASAGMLSGALMSMCLLALAAMGHSLPDLAPTTWTLLCGGFLIGPLFLLIESKVNRAKWQQWTRHMEHSNVWDIVTWRHIPQLRNSGA